MVPVSPSALRLSETLVVPCQTYLLEDIAGFNPEASHLMALAQPTTDGPNEIRAPSAAT